MAIVYGTPGAPSNTSLPDGTSAPALAGKAAELVVTELHGKYFTASYRNRHFCTQGAAAGVTIPVSTTTAPTFTIFNPIGSGIVIELGKLNVCLLNATEVVSSIAWGLIGGLLVAPTGTAMTTGSANIGSSSVPQAVVWSAATLVTAATRFFGLFSISAVALSGPNFNYDHEGSLTLQPGSLAHLCGTAAQSSASLNSLTWSEWPA